MEAEPSKAEPPKRRCRWFQFSLRTLIGVSVFGIALGGVRLVTGSEVKPFEAVLSTASAVTDESVTGWKREGFGAVAVVLDDGDAVVDLEKAAKVVADHLLGLYFWIEVGRNPALAREHPEWMASLGIHNDWRKRFPNVRQLEKGEVAKAWPWVPIRYRAAYDAHLKRIHRFLARAPDGYRGVLLNDLQGGPASCGCGNLQCRWATDYGVPSTTAKLDGADTAARFVTEVGRSINGKSVIPIWTTECEKEDLSADKLPQGSWSTGYCGDVPCLETCRKRFNEQWTALEADRRGPTGLLLLDKEFQRDRKEYGGFANWMTSVVESIENQGDKPYPPEQLWLVIQGYGTTADDETALRQTAVKTSAGAVLVARTRIDQSYEPRIVEVKPAP
jgi:hypothetical protein